MNPEARVYTAKSGEELTFLFTHRGLIQAEKSSGMGLGGLLEQLGQGGYNATGSLLHGGLIVNQPEVTLDDAFALWASDGPAVVKAMAEALNSAMPLVAQMLGVKLRPLRGAAKSERTPPRGTGSRSSARGAKRD